jgi:hypothetical protein
LRERGTGCRKSGKKTPKGSRTKKAAVKDLRVKDAKAIKGGATDPYIKIGDIKGESRD